MPGKKNNFSLVLALRGPEQHFAGKYLNTTSPDFKLTLADSKIGLHWLENKMHIRLNIESGLNWLLKSALMQSAKQLAVA